MQPGTIPSAVERRRLHLGGQLRILRARAGLSGPKLAVRSGVAQSHISRIERGQVTPHDAALTALLDALEVSPQERDDLLQELRSLRAEYASWQLLTEPGGGGSQQRALAEIERKTQLTREFDPCMVPGLLQTAAYARAVFSCWPHLHNDDRIADAIQGRMERQTLLFDEKRVFQFVLMEQALWLTIAAPDVMAAQFDRISQLSVLPNVHVTVLPLGTVLDCSPLTPFALLDDSMVMVGLTASIVNLRAKEDVALYAGLFGRLSEAALPSDDVRDWLGKHAARYSEAMRTYRRQA